MRILIGADIVPTKSNVELFNQGDVEALIGKELKCILDQADYRIFNLETPLTNRETPIEKCGEALIAPVESVAGLKAMNINLVTLCNNHIMDQDVQGLKSTIHILNQHQIDYVGVGFSHEEAAKPYTFICEGKKIGVYACAEHEFSIITDTTPGANPIDFLETFDHIIQLKKNCDYVIVLYHGGKEHYRYPSPNLQKICRKLVDKGADIVICQHSHCIGAEEKYNGRTIIYGQGNFLFDGSNSEYWQTSLLIQLTNEFQIEYIPIIKKENGVRLAEGVYADTIIQNYRERSYEISNQQNIYNNYLHFAETYESYFLSVASGNRYGKIIKILNRLSGRRLIPFIMRCKYNKSKKLALYNHITCEANQELFASILRLSQGEEHD